VTYDRHTLLDLTRIYPHQNNLLLVPHGTSSVPIIEVGETGLIHVTTPKLPKGTVNEMFIPSNGAALRLQLGSLYENARQIKTTDGLLIGSTTRPSQRIVEFDLQDGRILNQMEIGTSGVQPACESNGVFTFLSSDQETGFLQIVQAKVR
jgi:hypothetical protein